MNWSLKEHEQAMFKILEVVDGNGEVIKTFVTNQADYAEKKRKLG